MTGIRKAFPKWKLAVACVCAAACLPDPFLAFWISNSSGHRFFDLPNDGLEVRPVAGGEFGMELFAIDGDFKGATAGGDEGERPNAIAEFENLGRQTDGLRRVVSDHAVLDLDFGFHVMLLSWGDYASD